MDAIDHSTDPRSTGRDCKRVQGLLHQEVEVLGSLEPRFGDGEGWRLVDVVLTGGAPWGFTLRGGREHREPLLITKVEEGSKAAAVRLQVGDEIVNINEIPLSGYRQEAICLVKGSHKTLTLVVRRRNEPASRPHSWHSTKLTESQSEAVKTQSTPAPVWQARYDASSSSNDLSGGWDQTNLRRVSDQFSSLGSMDSLEHSHPYLPGRLSPAKSSNSVEHLGGGGGGSKRDSAYSSFSTASSTPDYTLSKSNAASTENMLYKVGQWEAGGRHSNGRHSQGVGVGAGEGGRPDYLQLPGGGGGRESPRGEEPPGSRLCPSSGRSNIGPVWHVPEKKKAKAPSPPPPLPPVRSDSFAVTKVHEKGLVIPYPEAQAQGRGADRGFLEGPEGGQRGHHLPERVPDSRHSYVPPSKNDTLHPYAPADSGYSSNNQFNSSKQYSLSSTDVRLGQPPYAYAPQHQRQYSEESTFYPQPRVASAPKPAGTGGCYYSSMQELPTNPAHLCGQSQARASSASLSAEPPAADHGPHSRYYCVTARQPLQSVAQASLVKVEGWRSDPAPPPGSQKPHKPKHPPSAQPCPDAEDSNGHCPLPDRPGALMDTLVPKPYGEERAGPRRGCGYGAESHYMSYPPSKHSEQKSGAAGQQRRPQHDPWLSREEGAICPQKTPMLHRLSQDGMGGPGGEEGGPHAGPEPLNGKQVRRSDRFATTLRNEIQTKRAQLQKSRSAATLSAAGEAEEDAEAWRAESAGASASSSSDGSFSSTYKDHLKEAQARVLQATSFRRRDLEPPSQEHPAADAGPGYPSTRKEAAAPLPGLAEALPSKPGGAGAPLSRIGGRKRFPMEKRVRSFSEPDKINEVGVEEDAPRSEAAGSLADRRKVFEATGKPAFSKPVPKQALQGSSGDYGEGKQGGTAHPAAREGSGGGSGGPLPGAEGQCGPLQEQQRLGTFAEYEATWNVQRKPAEARASGRYRSADNILDPDPDERGKPPYVHERSRSSPSADFYGENVPVQVRKTTEYSQAEQQPAGQEGATTRLSDAGRGETPEAEPSAEPAVKEEPESGDRPVPLSHHHHPHDGPDPGDPAGAPPPYRCPAPDPAPKKKGPVPQRPPPPKLDKYRRLGSASSLSDSQESLLRAQGSTRAARPLSPGAERPLSPARDSALSPGPFPGKDPQQGSGPEDEHRDAHRVASYKPEPPPLPPSSSSASSSSSSKPTSLLQPSMDCQRSPSPQFAPQRLTDRPPVSLHDNAPSSMGKLTEGHSAVKKVPVKIVHQAESSMEREGRPSPPPAEPPAGPQLARLGPSEPSYSLFSPYTRQRGQEPEGARDLGPSGARSPPGGPQEAPPVQDAAREVASPIGGSSEEDRKREELARDILGRDKSLADILDQTKMKTTMDLMEGIFPQGEQVLEEAQQRRRAAPKQSSPRSTEERQEEDNLAAAVGLVTSSSYYSTSAPKAELLIKMKDMQDQIEEQDSEDELDIDLANKKHELIDSLSRKLQVLREARESLREDVQANNALGDEVEATVQRVCKPNELDKFRMFVGDLDKVVSLLLSLSGRLARVENALNNLEEGASPGEKRTLTEKRKLLICQHEDAKELKENLDRRERVVYDILASYLSEDDLADYEHFVKMKSALIIEQRKLEDRIKLGEEQLKCLTDSLPLDQRTPY
ncbi:protein Shroom2-like isoform X2 [Megalops cyprinoides]|uniref:protein Shroom2-like isoform X2 n=1 Tax=Megalops cyprinoides TaxID=118141 RepID=UPI001863F7C3|nr:protein Shroom2-like isoform X2 [Megalops cyprinoides]